MRSWGSSSRWGARWPFQKRHTFLILFASLAFSLSALTPWSHGLESFFLDAWGRFLTGKNVLFQAASLSVLYPEKQKLDDLKQENAVLKADHIQAFLLRQENSALRKELKVTQKYAEDFCTAFVLNLPKTGQSFLVGAGKAQGVYQGAPVISVHGLVGFVQHAAQNTSRVLPLTHLDSKIPVVSSSGEAHAILLGDGTKMPTLLHKNPSAAEKSHQIYVSSGYGGRFPYGVPVGLLSQQAGKLIPFALFDRLKRVQIILKNAPKVSSECFEKKA